MFPSFLDQRSFRPSVASECEALASGVRHSPPDEPYDWDRSGAMTSSNRFLVRVGIV